ncbi:MAG: sulfur transferase domain-containing protein [Candidatus Scalindua sp.]|nr:sulfur transferase domain-containing protein [Candidatus Scalindua sp.]
MNCYIRVLSVAWLTLFIVSNVFADNITMDKRSFIRQVSSPLINLPNCQVPFDGVLAGGQPTFDQIKQAAETGFKAVINLRTDNELPDPAQELTWVEGSGMKYFHIPVVVTEGFTPQNAKLFADVLSKPENYPLIVHSKSGERVGAMFALKAFHIDGKEIDEALAIGERAGLIRLALTVKKILESY